jgi:hypothetical protein
MTDNKKKIWFGRDPNTGEWYWGGWKVLWYIPTTRRNYLINIALCIVLVSVYLYAYYIQNFKMMQLPDFISSSLFLSLFVFFLSYRMFEAFLTGKFIWNFVDIHEGKSAIYSGLIDLFLLIFFLLILGGIIHVW